MTDNLPPQLPSPCFTLALNCGSSSIKFALYETITLKPIIKGSATGIGGEGGVKLKIHDCKTDKDDKLEIPSSDTHHSLLTDILDYLFKHSESLFGQRGLLSHIGIVTHRIVHGGSLSNVDPFDPSQTVAVWKGHEESLRKLDHLSGLAPLHNHLAVLTIRESQLLLPHSVSLLFFDSTFHRNIPKHVSMYPVHGTIMNPLQKNSISEAEGHTEIKKWGFHGLSYSFITEQVASHLRKKTENLNLIILHLGSGSSACCVHNGKSIDTSMGLTPLEGLPGGTRSGTIDPSLMFHLFPHGLAAEMMDYQGEKISHSEYVLNKQSGLCAVTGGISDFQKIYEKMESGDESCKLAVDLFVDRVMSLVGAYYVKLAALSDSSPPIDALVFSGGIGEHSSALRSRIVNMLSRTSGANIDQSLNENLPEGVVVDISEKKEEAGMKVLVVRTDEEKWCADRAKDWARTKGGKLGFILKLN